MSDSPSNGSVSVILADSSGLVYAEIDGGELRRAQPIPWELAAGESTYAAAIRHERGLTVCAPIQASSVPLLVGSADGSHMRPVPGIPGHPHRAAVIGVTRDGTALVSTEHRETALTRLNGPCFLMRWGSRHWAEIDVPAGVRLGGVIGSASRDTAYVCGATGSPPAFVRGADGTPPGPVPDMRPALFEVDLVKRTVEELSLPAPGPTWSWWRRLRLDAWDPSGELDHGVGDSRLLVCTTFFFDMDWEDHGILHAIDRSRALWSTVKLRYDVALDLRLAADGTACVVTRKGRLWTYRPGAGWSPHPSPAHGPQCPRGGAVGSWLWRSLLKTHISRQARICKTATYRSSCCK